MFPRGKLPGVSIMLASGIENNPRGLCTHSLWLMWIRHMSWFPVRGLRTEMIWLSRITRIWLYTTLFFSDRRDICDRSLWSTLFHSWYTIQEWRIVIDWVAWEYFVGSLHHKSKEIIREYFVGIAFHLDWQHIVSYSGAHGGSTLVFSPNKSFFWFSRS